MTVERLREIEARAFAGSNAPLNNEALLRSMCFELIADVRRLWVEVANLNGALGTDRRTIDKQRESFQENCRLIEAGVRENQALRSLLKEALSPIEFATKFQNTDSLASRISDALGN